MEVTNNILLEIDLLRELASEFRYPLLLKLAEKSWKPSQLEQEIDISVQELHRQFERLTKAKLVKKDLDGLFSLTSYGQITVEQLSSFTFLENNKKYFENHSMNFLPSKFIHRIGELNNSKIVKRMFPIAMKAISIAKSAEKHLKVISTQIAPESLEPKIPFSEKGVKVSVIHGHNTTIAKGCKKDVTSKRLRKMILEGVWERRMTEKVSVIMSFNEKSALLILPNADGEVLTNAALYSEDALFNEWCTDYFDYVWNDSDDYDTSKIQES